MAATRTQIGNNFEQITIPWTSSAGGAYTETITIYGYLIQAEFAPGSPAPTDLYDITLPNANSVDVLAGTGANLSTSTASRKAPACTLTDGTNNSTMPFFCYGSHTFTVANAGSAKQGTTTLWVRTPT